MMTQRRSVTETEVPLYLVPQAIARQINKKGGRVYRISVKRTHWHHYNISVRTKSLPKELQARTEEVLALPCRLRTGRDESDRDDARGGKP